MNRQHELKWGGRKHLWHPREAKDLHQWLAVINNFKSSCITIWSACVHLKSHQSNLCYDHTVERGRCVCEWRISVWVLWDMKQGCPLLPTTGSDPGGQLCCDVAAPFLLVAPSGPLSPILLPCRAARCTCTPVQIKSPRSNFKSVSAGLFLGGNKTNLFP